MPAVQEGESFLPWVKRLMSTLVDEVRETEAPATHKILLLIAFTFVFQLAIAIIGGGNVRGATAWLFLNFPIPAWSLSFFFHQGFRHLIANIAIIGILGMIVEPRFSETKFWIFALTTGYLSTVTNGLMTAFWSSQPVSSYGASGFGFALAAYALFNLRFDQKSPFFLTTVEDSRLQEIGGIISIAAFVSTLTDPLTGVPFTANWINFAHLSGFSFGLAVAILAKVDIISVDG